MCGFHDPNYIRNRLLGGGDKVWDTDRSPTLDHICSQIIVEKVPNSAVATTEVNDSSTLNLTRETPGFHTRVKSTWLVIEVVSSKNKIAIAKKSTYKAVFHWTGKIPPKCNSLGVVQK